VEKISDAKDWYDGYEAKNGLRIYNPLSINEFIDRKNLYAYWVETGKILHCLTFD
jgi:hypothetical protein